MNERREGIETKLNFSIDDMKFSDMTHKISSPSHYINLTIAHNCLDYSKARQDSCASVNF